MKVINVRYDRKNDYCENAEFNSFDLRNLEEKGAEIVIYSYATGSYEGSGNALVKKGDTWYAFDCGHCSCYGPCENIELSGEGHKTLAALKKSLSPGSLDDIQPLLDAAKENNIE